LKVSKDGASTTYLGKLFQCLATLLIKKFLLTSFVYGKAAIRSTWSFLFSRLNNPNSLSSLSGTSALESILWPPLDPLHVLLVLGAPELDAGLQVGSHQSGVEGQNHLSQLGLVELHEVSDD